MSEVLLVEHNPAARERLADWLEDAGHEVLVCKGPGAPDYDCIASHLDRCPLADGAEVVVLDIAQAGDELLRGTPGWQLLLFYWSHGHKIVALSGTEDPVRPLPDDQVRVVRRPPERMPLLSAVEEVLGAPATPDEREPIGGDDVDDLAD